MDAFLTLNHISKSDPGCSQDSKRAGASEPVLVKPQINTRHMSVQETWEEEGFNLFVKRHCFKTQCQAGSPVVVEMKIPGQTE